MTTQEIDLFCDRCATLSVHEIISENTEKNDAVKLGPNLYDKAPTEDIFRIVRCKNCKMVSGQSEFRIDGETESQTTLSPKSSRRLPTWANKLPADRYSALIEIYNALRSGSYRLAVAGCRMLIEIVSSSKIGDVGGFSQKLEELRARGMISDDTKAILSSAINAGSASTHRGWQPTRDESNLVLDIVEYFLQGDVLTPAAQTLDKSVPKRQKGT